MTRDENLAAEFVIGTLDATERAEVRTRMAVDIAFAARVRAWERALAPLYELVTPIAPPPALWNAIAEDLDKTRSGGVFGGRRGRKGRANKEQDVKEQEAREQETREQETREQETGGAEAGDQEAGGSQGRAWGVRGRGRKGRATPASRDVEAAAPIPDAGAESSAGGKLRRRERKAAVGGMFSRPLRALVQGLRAGKPDAEGPSPAPSGESVPAALAGATSPPPPITPEPLPRPPADRPEREIRPEEPPKPTLPVPEVLGKDEVGDAGGVIAEHGASQVHPPGIEEMPAAAPSTSGDEAAAPPPVLAERRELEERVEAVAAPLITLASPPAEPVPASRVLPVIECAPTEEDDIASSEPQAPDGSAERRDVPAPAADAIGAPNDEDAGSAPAESGSCSPAQEPEAPVPQGAGDLEQAARAPAPAEEGAAAPGESAPAEELSVAPDAQEAEPAPRWVPAWPKLQERGANVGPKSRVWATVPGQPSAAPRPGSDVAVVLPAGRRRRAGEADERAPASSRAAPASEPAQGVSAEAEAPPLPLPETAAGAALPVPREADEAPPPSTANSDAGTPSAPSAAAPLAGTVSRPEAQAKAQAEVIGETAEPRTKTATSKANFKVASKVAVPDREAPSEPAPKLEAEPLPPLRTLEPAPQGSRLRRVLLAAGALLLALGIAVGSDVLARWRGDGAPQPRPVELTPVFVANPPPDVRLRLDARTGLAELRVTAPPAPPGHIYRLRLKTEGAEAQLLGTFASQLVALSDVGRLLAGSAPGTARLSVTLESLDDPQVPGEEIYSGRISG